jgi:hypothetical protein
MVRKQVCHLLLAGAISFDRMTKIVGISRSRSLNSEILSPLSGSLQSGWQTSYASLVSMVSK